LQATELLPGTAIIHAHSTFSERRGRNKRCLRLLNFHIAAAPTCALRFSDETMRTQDAIEFARVYGSGVGAWKRNQRKQSREEAL
jgi:hypothetical protein